MDQGTRETGTNKASGFISEEEFLSTLHGGDVPNQATARERVVNNAATFVAKSSTALRTSMLFTPFVMMGSMTMFATPAQAIPLDGTVVGGSATIQQTSQKRLDIVQTSSKAIIDWKSFSIGADETVNFDQQAGSGSITLNRVTGNQASVIAGNLTANGNIWLLNENGVMFSSTARVDVGGLLASTSGITNADFMSGNYNFTDTGSTASVINDGSISIKDGGMAAFVASYVANNGNITANLGSVTLAGGHTFTVDLYGDGLIQLAVDPALMPDAPLVENTGSIIADGGKIQLTAMSASSLVDNIINMSGIIQADSIGTQNGEIILYGGDNGIVNVSGTIHARGLEAGETGGTVQILGNKVGLFGSATVDASGQLGGGTILVGGDYQGQGNIHTAEYTYVGADVFLSADAIESGDGGKVILWSNNTTRFYGEISAQGGLNGGDGGFVEVSGKHNLNFGGFVDLSAANGALGTLLLDPDDIVIQDAVGPDDAQVSDGNVLFADGGAVTFTISDNAIEAQLAVSSVVLQANNTITVNASIEGANNANDLTLLATGTITLNAAIDMGFNGGTGDLNLQANEVEIGANIAGAGALTITTGTFGQNIEIAGAGGTAALDLTATELNFIQDGFSDITIGGVTAGNITMLGAYTFKDAITFTTGAAGKITIGAAGVTTHLMTNGDNITLDSGTGGIQLGASMGSSILSQGGDITLLDDITFVNGTTIDSGAGTLSTQAVNIGATSSTLKGDEINFGGAVSGTGALVLDSGSVGTIIEVGGADSLTAGTLELDTADLAQLQNGFSGITIGSFGHTGDINIVSATTINDAFTLFNSGAGKININADLTVSGALNLVNFGAGINLGANISSTGNLATFGTINLTANSSINTNTATLGLQAVNAGTFDLTLQGDEIDWTGAVSGTGNLTLRAGSAGTQWNFGTIATSGGILDITQAELGNIADGFNSLTFGSAAESGNINVVFTVGGLSDNTTIINGGAGKIDINFNVTAAGATNLTFDSGTGGIDLGGNITTAGGTINFADAVNLTTNSSIQTGAGVGSVTFQGAVDGAHALTVNSGAGTTTFQIGVGGTTALTALTLDSTGLIEFQDTVRVAGNIDIDTATLSANDTLTTTGGGTMTITNTGAAGFSGAITSDGAFLQDGAGAVSLGANVTTTNDNITFAGPLTMTSSATIDAGAGMITTQAINAGATNLTLQADEINWAGNVSGTGNLTLRTGSAASTMGIGGGFGTLDISVAELALLQDGFNTLTFGDATQTGNIAVGSNVTFADSINFINGGAGIIDVNGTVATSGADNITFDSGTGGIQLENDVTTAGGDITFLNDVTSTGAATTISAGAGTVSTQAFDASAWNLTIQADEINFGGNISSAANTALTLASGQVGTAIEIGGANSLTGGLLELDATDLGFIQDGFGSIKIGSASQTGDITIAGATSFQDALVLQNNAGAGKIAIDAALSTTGADVITIASGTGGIDLGADVTTVGGNITFVGNTTMDGNATLDTGAGAGNVTFTGTLLGDAAGNNRNLTITAGTGTADFQANVFILNDVNISADEIQIGASLSGNGTLTLNSGSAGTAIEVGGAGGTGSLDITNAEISNIGSNFNVVIGGATLTGDIVIAGSADFGQNVTFKNAGAAKIDINAGVSNTSGLDNITFDSGTGGINLGAGIPTVGGNITFEDDVTLTNNVNIQANTGNITFNGALDGAFNLGLTGGDILFNGNVGQGTALGNMTITSANNVTLGDAFQMDLADFTQNAGAGTTNFGLTGINATGDLIVHNSVIVGNVIDANSISAQKTASINLTGGIGGNNTASQSLADLITLLGGGAQHALSDFNGFRIGGPLSPVIGGLLSGTDFSALSAAIDGTKTQLSADRNVAGQGKGGGVAEMNPVAPAEVAFDQYYEGINVPTGDFENAGKDLIDVLKTHKSADKMAAPGDITFDMPNEEEKKQFITDVEQKDKKERITDIEQEENTGKTVADLKTSDKVDA